MHGGYIYLVRCGEYHKIGYTRYSPIKRLSVLQTGNPFRLELIGMIHGSPTDERRFHVAYESKRVRGEWFALLPDDVESILSSAPPATFPSSHEELPQRYQVILDRIWEKERAAKELDQITKTPGLGYKIMDMSARESAQLFGELRKIREEYNGSQ